MTNDEYYAYVRAWKERFELQDKNRKLLARRARRDAKAIAKMLYRDFSVSTVYLFGSALDDMRFRETSDIDRFSRLRRSSRPVLWKMIHGRALEVIIPNCCIKSLDTEPEEMNTRHIPNLTLSQQ